MSSRPSETQPLPRVAAELPYRVFVRAVGAYSLAPSRWNIDRAETEIGLAYGRYCEPWSLWNRTVLPRLHWYHAIVSVGRPVTR